MITANRRARGALGLTTALTALALLAPLAAQAREGAPSVGHGLKCSNIVTTDPATGRVTVTQVCRKGV